MATKKNKIVHKIGNRYQESNDNETYLLVRTSKTDACLIDVDSGIRWRDAYPCKFEGLTVSQKEFDKIAGTGVFKLIENKQEPLIKLFLINKYGLFKIGEVEDTAFARRVAVDTYSKKAKHIQGSEYYVLDETQARDWINFLEDELN